MCVRHNCKKMLPKAMFSRWLEGKKTQKKNGQALCNECVLNDKKRQEDLNEENHSQVQKPASSSISKKRDKK